MSDAAFDKVLDIYRRRMADEEALLGDAGPTMSGVDVNQLLLSVGEDAAEFLRTLAIGLGAKIIVELGTSYGFSTLFLADAARRTGGKVHSYDLAGYKQDWARERLIEAGLDGFVTFHTGDAVELLKVQPGPVDFVLLDVWKDLYIPCLERIYPLLADNGVIAADNMLIPVQVRAQAAAYQAAVRAKPDMQAVLLTLGQGIDLACKVVVPT